jgi:stage III sporulation protein AG
MLEKMFEKVFKKYKNIIIIVGIAGIALIFLSSFFTGNSKSEGGKSNSSNTTITDKEYTLALEQNLTDIITHINGAGDTKVMVTIENGVQTQYATETKTNTESGGSKASGKTETNYITVKDSNGNEHAIALTEYAPKVRGVVVICDGGSQPVIQKRITDAVTTALNIPSNHVCVTR